MVSETISVYMVMFRSLLVLTRQGVEVFADRSNRDNGFIQWFANSKKAWYMPASAIGEDPDTKIGKRLISEEPMAMVRLPQLLC